MRPLSIVRPPGVISPALVFVTPVHNQKNSVRDWNMKLKVPVI